MLFLGANYLCAKPDTLLMGTTYSTIDLDCGDEWVIYDNGGSQGCYFGSGARYVTINTVGTAIGKELHISLVGKTYRGSTSDVLSVYDAVSSTPGTLPTGNRVWYGDGVMEWQGVFPTGCATLKFNVPYSSTANRYEGFEVRVWVCCVDNDIENVTVESVSRQSASLSWDDLSGTATGWMVCYGLEEGRMTDTVRVSSPDVTLTGLFDNTPYYVAIFNNTTTLVTDGRCLPNLTEFTTLPDSSLSVGCVDFKGIHSAGVRAYYGLYGNPHAQEGVVDYGSLSMGSRHTVHSDTSERDARTGGLLRTIPIGETASVRLGNWNVGNQSEELVYTMVVDTAVSDMILLRYAAVLQNPTHGATIQPRLLYSIKKADGSSLGSEGCYDVEFVANGSLGWHTAADDVIWKDWTSVGMSLSGLDGDTIEISLTTKDCNESAPTGGTHYGYAYFTITCQSMDIHYSGCAAEVGDTVWAPEGFDYAWYRLDDAEDVLDTTRQFVIPSGGNYACRLGFVGADGTGCSFVQKVTSDGLRAEADFGYTMVGVGGGCERNVQFENRSRVYVGSDLQEGVECDAFEWHFPDGTVVTEENSTYTFAAEGSYSVTLVAKVNGGCDDTTERTLTIVCDTTPLPDNVDSSECSFAREPSSWGIMVDDEIGSFYHVCTLITPFVGDLDGDGVVEIVCFSTDGGSNVGNAGGTVRKILIFDGISHALKYSFMLGQPVSAFDAAPYGLVKLPSGQGLIVVACTDRNLYAYDVNGSLQWTSSTPFGTGHDYSTNVGFADFNNDGSPEVYVRNSIYNAETGELLATASATNVGAAYAHTYTATPWQMASSFATNLIGDSRLELLLGNEIYSVDITNTTGTAGNSITLAMTAPAVSPSTIPADGHGQVADFNLDGHLDVFISNRKNGSASSEVYGYVWDVYNNEVSAPFRVTTTRTGKSIPLIADIDNDDSLEVVIHCGVPSANLRAYKYHADSRTFTEFWTMGVSEDSYSNCMTLFDFNLDGESELLICDQNNISIVNGGTAGTTSVISSLAFKEVTIMQYPVIADVDNDGAAEIVFVGNASSMAVSGTLNICRSNGTPWAPARPVWNQYMYNITNVNKDLTIPTKVYNNSSALVDPDSGVVRRPYNNFFQQATITDEYGRPFYVAPDLTVFCDTDSIVYTDTNMMVPIRYCNTSEAKFDSTTVYVSLYKVKDGVRTLLATVPNPPTHPFGQVTGSCLTQRFDISKEFLCPFYPIDSLVFEVNSQGHGIAQNGGLAAECDSTNNTITVEFLPFPIVRDTVYDTVCQGVAYSGHGFVIPSDSTMILGQHFFNDTISGSCESYLTLSLEVLAAQHDTLEATACGFFAWNGHTYTQTGLYSDTVSSTSHCYVIESLDLTIFNDSIASMEAADACETYLWRGREYTSSGVYSDTVSGAVHGVCDSIYRLNLMVYQEGQAPVQTIDCCDGYWWRGRQCTVSGLYSDTVTNAVHGVCDSIYTITLNVYHDRWTATEREGCRQYEWRGTVYSTSGGYSDTVFNAVEGVCDSVYFLTLTIFENDTAIHTMVACNSYEWRGRNYTDSGQYFDTVQGGVEGVCDSIYQLNLTLYSDAFDVYQQSACENYRWRGQDYYVTGTYSELVRGAVAGVCDSMYTLYLTIYQHDTVEEDKSACDTYTWFGTQYSASGRFSHIVPNAVGGVCDSVFFLNLSIYHDVAAVMFDTICDIYHWHGQEITRSGFYYDTVRNAVHGVCDSTYKLYLTVRHSSSSIFSDTVNEQQLPFYFHHRSYDQEVENDTVVLVNAQQCDSVVYFSLYVLWHYETCSKFLQFPNLVTPNGDGINDNFEIKNLIEEDCYPHNRLTIYDRWGGRVFSVENISQRSDFWNPNATHSPDGTYFFTFVGSGLQGKVERHGVIEVLR